MSSIRSLASLSSTNVIRGLAIDMIQAANSGHPGAPLGLAPFADVLWAEQACFDPKHPLWHNRDRIVLSGGHACALLYSILHLCGYAVPLIELQHFRQFGSITPGHPERGMTPGVEVTTGPLGQGVGNAVGLAIAEAHLAAIFNESSFPLVDHHTFCILGDGCLMEGVAQEALSLAGHLGLDKLILIYDDNHISIDGNVNITFTENTKAKMIALGFDVMTVENGDTGYDEIRAALSCAKASRNGKPKFIMLQTTIGYGSVVAGTSKAHGAPLGTDEVARMKREVLGLDPNSSFVVTPEVYEHFGQSTRRTHDHNNWQTLLISYRISHPNKATLYDQYFSGQISSEALQDLPMTTASIATRQASQETLSHLLQRIPNLLGGSADLTGSNLTRPAAANLCDFQRGAYSGRYLRFGIREHGMASILNGLDAHGGLFGFGATFLNFISYALGAVRLSALSHHRVIYVATHDSIDLGEDGPTHQPMELLATLRATPNLLLIRPADQTETSSAWALALTRNPSCPTILCLSRGATGIIPGTHPEGVSRGAYIVLCNDEPTQDTTETKSLQLIIIASGTEVQFACMAAEILASSKYHTQTRVISMPCWSTYDEQPTSYKAQLFPEGIPILSVEPYTGRGWERYSHHHVGLRAWGASAPAPTLREHFGLTPSAIATAGFKLVRYFQGKQVPSKIPIDL